MIQNRRGWWSTGRLCQTGPDRPRRATVEDLTGANAAAAAWCGEVNTCRTRRSRRSGAAIGHRAAAAGEVAVAAAPARRQADQPQSRQTVLCTVWLGPLLGAEPADRHHVLLSVADQQRVRVLEPVTGQVVAEHALVAPGETSIDDAHYGSARPDKPRRAPRAKTTTEREFLALGETAAAFLTGAAAAGVAGLTVSWARSSPARRARPAGGAGRAGAGGGLPPVACRRRRSILAAAGAAPTLPARSGAGAHLPTVPVRPLSDYSIDHLQPGESS